MTSISITNIGPDRFGVAVEEGQIITNHELVTPPGALEELGLGDVDAAAVAEQSIAFLLDRVPATTIGDRLSIGELADRYPGFVDELRARLGPS